LKERVPMKKKRVVTIDGPAGAGKSTISKLLAERLAYIYLDTGALYRAVAYRLIQKGFSGREEEILPLCSGMKVDLQEIGRRLHVLADGQDAVRGDRPSGLPGVFPCPGS
jgi:cytidylate kinase